MKALLYTSDPYEPSGVIGLFESEEQKKEILRGYRSQIVREHLRVLNTYRFPTHYAGRYYQTRKDAFCNTIEQHIQQRISELKERDIPLGKYVDWI